MNNLSINDFMVSPDASVRELMELIGENTKGFAIVADDGKLLTTLTNGDLRRALLDGVRLDDAVSAICESKEKRGLRQSIVVHSNVSDEECFSLMSEYQIAQLPVVDTNNNVVDVVFRDDLVGRNAIRLSYLEDEGVISVSNSELNAYGVIMAGGFGTRLHPLTEQTPKPMLPVNGKPLLEYIVEGFEKAGVRDIYLSTYYKRHVIEEYFEDGARYNVNIEYLHEENPIGTAGALSMVRNVDRPMVVTNGDILTKVGWAALLDFHHEHEAMITVGVRQYDMTVPFGVMNVSGEQVTAIEEKPTLDFLVNAGVYVISEEAHTMIPSNTRYDMTELIEAVLAQGGAVVAYPIAEYWIDIGRMADYEKVQTDHC